VDKLEFLEYTITSQDIHAAAEQDPFFLLLCVFVCSGGGLFLIIKKKEEENQPMIDPASLWLCFVSVTL